MKAAESRIEVYDSSIIERFRLETLLGKGGFGEVWKAFDLQRNKYVAIKGPRTDRPISPAHVQQFLAEAEKVQRVGGNAVVPVLDVVHCPARKTGEFLCFIVMELMAGGSLGEKCRQSYRPTARETVTLAIQLTDKLSQIHSQGFIHRDVKPDNILFDAAGQPFFSDFGLAVSDDEQLKEAQCVRGTVSYMAPEQARQQRVDRLADIYSFGVVIYQLLALPYVTHPRLALPYLANDSEEYLELLSDERQQIRALPAAIPNDLAALIENHCLTADKTQRFRSAPDLASALRRWQRRHWWTRRKLIAVGAGILATGAAAGGTAAWGPGLLGRWEDVWDVENSVDLVDLAARNPHQKSEWNVSEAGDRLEVRSDDFLLISFGNCELNTIEWEITIVHEQWEKGVGLFFGHGTAADTSKRFYHSIIPARKSDGSLDLRIRCSTYSSFNPQGLQSSDQIGIKKGPELPLRFDQNRIRLVMNNGLFANLWINDIDLTARVFEPLRKLETQGASTGPFGVVTSGLVSFLNPFLNKAPLRIKKS